MFILFYLSVVGLLGVHSKPHERVLLVSAHQIPQNVLSSSEQQNVIFLTKSPLQQQSVPAYLSQNGVVYLRDEPQPAAQAGYVEPIYSWLSRDEQTKPVPEGMMPPPVPADQIPEQTPTDQQPEEPALKDSDKDIELNTETSTTDQKNMDAKPLKLIKKKTSNLEDLEPDAEIIPDSVKKTEKPIERQPPFFRPETNGIIPGQKFFILNNPQQFVGHNPFFGYSPINNHLRPQPSVRFEGVGGFPQRFLILGQHPTVQAQGGQAVILLAGQPDENLRSLHAQKVQIPASGLPLQSRQEDFDAQPEQNLIPQPEQLYFQSPQQLQQVVPLQSQEDNFERQQVSINERLLASISEQQNQLFRSQNEQQQRIRFAQQQFLQMYQAPQQHHPNLLHPSQSIHSYGQPQGTASLQFSRFLTQPGPAQNILQQQDRELSPIVTDIDNDSESIDANYESSGDSETIDAKYEMFDETEAPKNKPELVHTELPENPAVAQSRPSAIALAGVGGSAQAYPSASAIAGPQGLAVSDPSATAVAGHLPYKSKSETAH